ncbi:hypothetical protein PCH_Pc16g09700 [Penicillium rubens Wisconsin 54-1255]|uniref:Uncharacterized protein n=1 Tax=Penicillium rubens (strain ATCC 28089 / DSM 1075 / NRRL 1951 / Wisconsin 54-1255) TaxID=500485 RepID=B6H8K7_PENRW|nr:hypothetical protein PCH_Pc16g09700 [Penicillium rubens Wisconsin 54-1255]
MLRFFATHGEPHSPSSQLWVPPRAVKPLANEKFGGIFKTQPASSFDFAQTSGGGACPDAPGRVGAKIVCDDTLVQYAAYLALSSLRRDGWYHSIPIILVGWRFTLFFSGQFLLPPPGSFACGLVGFRSLRFGVGFVGFYPKWWTINYSWNTSLC